MLNEIEKSQGNFANQQTSMNFLSDISLYIFIYRERSLILYQTTNAANRVDVKNILKFISGDRINNKQSNNKICTSIYNYLALDKFRKSNLFFFITNINMVTG